MVDVYHVVLLEAFKLTKHVARDVLDNFFWSQRPNVARFARWQPMSSQKDCKSHAFAGQKSRYVRNVRNKKHKAIECLIRVVQILLFASGILRTRI